MRSGTTLRSRKSLGQQQLRERACSFPLTFPELVASPNQLTGRFSFLCASALPNTRKFFNLRADCPCEATSWSSFVIGKSRAPVIFEIGAAALFKWQAIVILVYFSFFYFSHGAEIGYYDQRASAKRGTQRNWAFVFYSDERRKKNK